MSERTPAEVFPVADFVREEMTARGWTPDDLARMGNWTRLALDALLSGTEPLTEQDALNLERCFGSSQQFWLNLELAYRRCKHARAREAFTRRAVGLPGETGTE